MLKKKRVINISIYIIMICIILFLAVDRNKLAKEVNSLDDKYASLNDALNNTLETKDANIKVLTDKIEELNSTLNLKNEMIEQSPKLDALMLENLKAKGIDDPIKLAEDLMKHPELIPYKGSLGGKMSFFSTEDIFVLSDRWVLAYFEDGHSCGYMLLRYEITRHKDNIEINWKPIESYLF